MANVNSTQHAAGVEQCGPYLWGTYDGAELLSATDTITFFEAPAGTTVVGGWLIVGDVDTGIETLEIDIGDASDPDRFLDSGVITGDAVVGYMSAAMSVMPLAETLAINGPYTYTTATNVIGTIVGAAATAGTGNVTLVMAVTQYDARVSPPTAPV